MEFATQGAVCAYDMCRQRDYLPFECLRCQHQFCLAHRTREQHECPSLAIDEAATRTRPAPIPLPPKVKCHHPGCKIKELQPNFCRNCAHSYCLKHRFPTSHACESFNRGVGRNTILKAGLVPPRPLDQNKSTDSSVQPIATSNVTPTNHQPHTHPTACTPPTQLTPTPIVSSFSTSVGVSTPSASSVLIHSNGQSCAAEMHLASNSNLQQAPSSQATVSDHVNRPADPTQSTSSSSSESSLSSMPHANARRQNTNIAHLSKLLKQHA